jgi:hypothetical protein
VAFKLQTGKIRVEPLHVILELKQGKNIERCKKNVKLSVKTDPSE